MKSYFEKLAWDTEFFSFPVGRVSVSALDGESVRLLLAQAQQDGIKCLYFEADPNDPGTVMTAERNGFHLVDVRVVLECPFDERPAPLLHYPIPGNLLVTPGCDEDLPRLEEISMEIGKYSRFTFDLRFNPGDDKKLYRLWIQNSFKGFADVVYVARWQGKGDEAAGLITCTMRNGIGHIQLAGVHHEHRQKGVGTALVQAALDWAGKQGAKKMQVVTQARNVPAQRLYQQMGFFTRSMTLYYHKWI